MTKNPQCEEQQMPECDKVLLVYIQADSEVDRLHYLYDFSGSPSVLIAKSDKNSSLVIDWPKFIQNSEPGSIKILPNATYGFATVIDNIIIYNDTFDRSNVSDSSTKDLIKINPHNINWDLVRLSESNQENATLEMKGNYDNGSFSIIVSKNCLFLFQKLINYFLQYTTYGSPAHGVDLPHLFHTAHSMQIDLVAEKINSTYTNPRIAIELLMVSEENRDDGNYAINRIRNLDDEFTPGIFDVYNVVSPLSNNNDNRGSFLQYRPVCYISSFRSVASSTETRNGYPTKIDSPFTRFQFTLPYAYFGYELHSKLNQALNITFGMPGDEFYSRTNYVSFSYLMGIGSVPLEGLSPFVITFAVIGLGVPLLVLIIGGTYVAVKRYSG